MKVLIFDKPEKIRSTEEHNNRYSPDSGIAGTYVPNMSEEDMRKWKAKHIKGEDERIEIRKTLSSQVLIIVYKNPRQVKWDSRNYKEWAKNHQNIKISMNGPLHLTLKNYQELIAAIEEAKEILDIK